MVAFELESVTKISGEEVQVEKLLKASGAAGKRMLARHIMYVVGRWRSSHAMHHMPCYNVPNHQHTTVAYSSWEVEGTTNLEP
jgi:hypothetical protein